MQRPTLATPSPETSGPNWLVLKKGVTLVSWGSQLTVHFVDVGPACTRLTVTTAETLAITDWGRGSGRRAGCSTPSVRRTDPHRRKARAAGGASGRACRASPRPALAGRDREVLTKVLTNGVTLDC